MSNWVICSDRMPEIGEKVLIRIPVCGHWNVENGEYRGEGNWYGAWCSSHGKDYSYKVLQWAPMPDEPL